MVLEIDTGQDSQAKPVPRPQASRPHGVWIAAYEENIFGRLTAKYFPSIPRESIAGLYLDHAGITAMDEDHEILGTTARWLIY